MIKLYFEPNNELSPTEKIHTMCYPFTLAPTVTPRVLKAKPQVNKLSNCSISQCDGLITCKTYKSLVKRNSIPSEYKGDKEKTENQIYLPCKR